LSRRASELIAAHLNPARHGTSRDQISAVATAMPGVAVAKAGRWPKRTAIASQGHLATHSNARWSAQQRLVLQRRAIIEG
jgi:hypothetical protein